MEALVIGSYWFISGIVFVLFVGKILEIREKSLGWFVGLFLAICIGVLLLFGATVCFDHSF